MRRGLRVEAEELVRVDGLGAARLAALRAELRARRDEPRLAGIRIKASLEERLARASLVGNGREKPMHAGARGCSAHAGEETEGAVGTARFVHRREQQKHPLRTAAVIHEGDAAELAAVLLDEDVETAAGETDEAEDETAQARHRPCRERHGERRRKHRVRRIEAALEKRTDARCVEW